MQQQTIQKPAELEGLGLFSGEPAKLRFLPGEPDTGRVFIRRDGAREVRIPAHVASVAKRSRRTSLRNGTLSIETTEHCLAAVSGLGIDNVQIEVDGAELPSLDGSALRFVEALTEAGLAPQAAERRPIRVTEAITVQEGDAMLAALPSEGDNLTVMYELDYPNWPIIGRQLYSVTITPETFVREVAPARTFLTQDEATEFRSRGMGAHLTPKDLLVFGPNGPIDNEARFANEPVRHKILDLVGDLALSGRPIAGRVVACKSGHSLNHALVRRLLQMADRQENSARVRSEPTLDIRQISRILPHRYPMLLVDRVVQIDGDRKAVGIKNVTFNELFFQGHYPGQPIMPGVLIVEALAQLSGILLSQKLEHTGKLAVLLSMDKVKMRRPVVPGDQLVLVAETIRVKSRTGHVKCEALVGDKLAAEAEIKFMLVDAEPV
ncbi:MAG: UDP-3-O-acyl-N-acetylglucosamine deacetylase [Phycisphaerae bacterium]|nr:UDP-3-O-acyl-N-acetylglucosamine deacetylase [Phycisphaerae bacterium]